MTVHEELVKLAREAKDASLSLRTLSSETKNRCLSAMARELNGQSGEILKANAQDLKQARDNAPSAAFVDRLTLTPERINDMAEGLEAVAALPDPVGEVVKMWRRPNDLLVGKMRIPLGVIGIIYESRPNVTADAVGLCLKSGNAVILRGGSESLHSNMAIASILQKTAEKEGVRQEVIQIVSTTHRDAVQTMLKLSDCIDLIIPRGGEALIRFVTENSNIPVIQHFKGVCHIFIDEPVDLNHAERITFNAKVQRPGVCNALETLLVHENVADTFLPRIETAFKKARVELRGCEKTRAILPDALPATEDDWHAEYLDLILSVRVVSSIEEAMAHIHQYGSQHTETIITENYQNAQRFLREVDSSVILVNASTRFSDGYQLGLGAEIGISTSKLHAFGPMGLEELTSTKFIVYGNGQIRES